MKVETHFHSMSLKTQALESFGNRRGMKIILTPGIAVIDRDEPRHL